MFRKVSVLVATASCIAAASTEVDGGGPIHGLRCHNPVVDSGVAAIPLVTPGYTLVQATVHQRHMDRWVYSHSLISNYCWPKQKNSTDQTMARECEFNRSSVWEAFPFEGDPYAAPSQGSCNPKQITEQGLYHGKLLGDAYRKMMLASAHDTSSSGTTSLCGPSNVGLEMDSAEKNQRTAMQVYLGLCGTLPTPEQYPAWSSIDNGTVAKGKPFFLSSGICASPALKNLSAIAKAAIEKDPFATELLQTSAEVAAATGKAKPNLGDAATLLDNVEDCVVVHACHGLDDVPKDFHGSSLLERVDVAETRNRGWPFYYWNTTDKESWKRFVANDYGYYFVVLLDRMRAAIDYALGRGPSVPKIFVQVTSDSIITPQLLALNLVSSAKHRPPWGAGLIYQLLRREREQFFVRVIYNGEDQLFMEFDAFARLVDAVRPSQADCARFFKNY